MGSGGSYVYVYDTDPDAVTYGYLPGYYGAYFAWGVMAFGTGWYYPPYTSWGPVYPVYYPYAYSYGAGAWYNPNTGTYGRGAVAYGPYGGVGRAAAYNPGTGTYARGVAAYGPYQSRAWAEAYNPRTGTYAQTRQGSNAYGSWGTTAVVRGDDWVRTARVSGSAGSAAGYRTSAGGSGVVVRGDNNVYAGRDGQVYRRTDEGWQRHESGQWQGVARPEPGTAVQREQPAASARTVDAPTYSGLSRDAQYRAQGSAQAAQSRSWSSSAAGGARPSPAARGSYGGRGGGRR